jgi:ectoine hydroxylase-related dioxygenase (phytanoyl-CoA dioxygenase family)
MMDKKIYPPLAESQVGQGDLKKELREKGYLYFKNFFDAELINECKQAILSVLWKLQWLEYPSTKCSIVYRLNSPEFYQCIETLMEQEVLHTLAYSPKLQSLMSLIIGVEPFAHFRKMIRLSYPFEMNPKDLTPPHQDIFYVRGEVDTFTCWIPLGNYPRGLGGLQVAECSHMNGIYSSSANDEGRFGCQLADIDESMFNWKQADYQLGDLLLFHSLTLHAAAPNFGDEFRISLDCRFSSTKGVINEDQLLPPYYPKVRAWEELTKQWKNPHRFQIPQSLTIQSAQTPLEEVMSRPSLYV